MKAVIGFCIILLLLSVTGCAENLLSSTPVEITATYVSEESKGTNPNPSVFSYPEDTSQLIELVMTKLNNGEEIPEIVVDLEKRRKTITSVSLDFNGDGTNELFLTGTIRKNHLDWLSSVYWIVSKSQNGYKIEYSLSPDEYLYAGNIYEIGDINGDKLPDLLVASADVGGGDCGQYLFIFSWQNQDYIHYRAWTDLCIDIVEVTENNELVITGQMYETFGSGPTRKTEEYFQRVGTEYLLGHSKLLSSQYRIHILMDAQEAYDAGDDSLAVQLWDKAAHDQSLINFPSIHIENDQPEIYQPAFALYRLYTYYLANDDKTTAEQYLNELRNLVGKETSPGGELLSLASEAKILLNINTDSADVCVGIYEYLNSTDENAYFMVDHWDWGYLNGLVEFCPLRRE
jgi:hypothetical protein